MATAERYTFLGKSGLKVSNICLGTMTFGDTQGGPVQTSEEDAHTILDKYVEWGGNFIDTADIYSKGVAEEILGRWLCKQQRERLVIATKLRVGWEDDPNATGLSRVRIMKAVEDSLHRLQTDYIDLYQIHCWDAGVPLEETMCALNDLVTLGKVRYLGCSNLTGWQLQKSVDLCRERGWHSWVSIQQQWSLLSRGIELEVTDVCENEGIGVLPWSPLKGGVLTGKYLKHMLELPKESRLGISYATGNSNQTYPSFAEIKEDPKVWQILEVMGTIAKQHSKTVAQVALRWLLQKDVVTSVVIGAKTLEQLEDNLAASTGWELTQAQMETLDEVSAVEIPYPYEMVWRVNKTRKRKL